MKLLLLFIGGALAQSSPAPQNFTIPSIRYVPPQVLQLYGLNGTFGAEPPSRITKEDKAAVEDTVWELFKDLTNQSEVATLGTIAKLAWTKIENKKVVGFYQWASAHLLNAVFATQTIVAPANETVSDAFKIVMGGCVCSRSPLLAKLQHFCSQDICVVTEKDANRAYRTIKEVSRNYRFFDNLRRALSSDKVPLVVAGGLAEDLHEEMLAAAEISAEFQSVLVNYHYLLTKEQALFHNMTLEEFVASRMPSEEEWDVELEGDSKPSNEE